MILLKRLISLIFLQCILQGDDVHTSTEIRSFGLGVSIEKVDYSVEGNQNNFEVPHFALGNSVHYVGPSLAEFYIRSQPTSSDHEDFIGQSGKSIASVHLNPLWSKVLLIWSRGQGGDYSVMAIPDDSVNFPSGHIRFVNLTPYRLGIVTTDKERNIALPAGDWIIDANGREAVYYTAILEGEGELNAMISNVIEMRDDVRRTVFFAISNAVAMGGDGEALPQFSFFLLTDFL